MLEDLQNTAMNSATDMAKSSIYDLSEIDALMRKRDIKKKVQASVYRHLFQCESPHKEIEQEVYLLCEEFRLQRRHEFLQLEKRSDSKIDQASKLLFKTRDGYLIESVILRSLRMEKNSICVSSQVGCTEKCHFCATGSLPFKRNLTKDEILDQVIIMRRILHSEGRRLTHVVFMGMGEPLRNPEAVSQSLGALTSMRHFKLSPKAITVSTLGIPAEMVNLAKNHPLVNLALSLHAPNDQLRSEIMPINFRHPISELIQTMAEIEKIRRSHIMVSYILFEGINDSNEQAQHLAELFAERRIIFNLIPFNVISDREHYRRTDEVQMNVFKRILMSYGFQVTVRRSFGPDIDAACGQLAARQPQLA
jgi:23S rRNA (adenine2503-C2)-methyltransferase